MNVVARRASPAQIVLEHSACARLPRADRLDFCCRGALALAEECAALSLAALLAKILTAAKGGAMCRDF